jgi:Tol biopolymer transport system component
MPRGPVRLRVVSLVSLVAVLASYLALAVAPTASAVPSADASAIAFTVVSGGVSSIWTMAPDGTNPVEISGQPVASNTAPAVSPDGTQVAFTSTPSGGTSDIWVMDVAGGGLTQLTNDPGNDSNPAWSSDGNTIAFQSDRAGNLDIWLMNPDGSSQSDLTGSSSATDSQPAWFPGLRRIAFVSTRSGHTNIWAENAGGTRITHVTTSTGPDTQPSVDPAGKLIAFTSRRSGNYDIYTVPVDGGTNTRVTMTSSVDTEPAFSTDSRSITFTSDRSGLAQVWRMPRPSGTATQLTNGVDPAGGSEWIPYTYPSPSWAARYPGTRTRAQFADAVAQSPDGNKLFVTGTRVNTKGYAVGGFLIAYNSTNGSTIWSQTFNGSSGYGASYAVAVSPDGSKVYVAGWVDDSAHVGEYSTTNGTLLAHSDIVWGPAFASAFGIVVSPDNSRVFVSGTFYAATGLPRGSETYSLNATTLALGWHESISRADPIQSQIRLSPDGGSLYWIGFHYGDPTDYHQNDYITVKYQTGTAQLLWWKTYNGPANGEDDPWGLALSPDGSMAYVTGFSVGGPATKADQAVVAYATSNGNQQWVSRFDSPNHGSDEGFGIAVSPDGTTVYTAGDRSRGSGSNLTRDLLATSIDASDGSLNWYAFYNGPGDDTASGGDQGFGVNVTPDGSTVYVSGTSYRTGTNFDMTSVGYDTSGNQVWLGRYDGPANGFDAVHGDLLSPDGSQLYVIGQSLGTYWDAATVTWSLPSCPCRPIGPDADAASVVGGGPRADAGSAADVRRSLTNINRLLRSGLSRSLHPVRRL